MHACAGLGAFCARAGESSGVRRAAPVATFPLTHALVGYLAKRKTAQKQKHQIHRRQI